MKQMRKTAWMWALLASTAMIGWAAPVRADSLQEALAQAYSQNPSLAAARAALRAADEKVSEAEAGRRPNLEANGSAGLSRTATEDPTSDNDMTPRSLGIQATQPIWRFGRIQSAIDTAENSMKAQRAQLDAQEQSLLLSAATTYLDVLRDQSVFDLASNNEQVLERQLQASRDRFEVGEITRTDVSQSEARLARARSDRVESQGALFASRAAYQRLVGSEPQNLSQPELALAEINLDEAVQQAESANPNVQSAIMAVAAAQSQVEATQSELLPDLSLTAGAQRSWETSMGVKGASDAAQVQMHMRVPLYQSGAEYARLRGAQQQANQKQMELDEARRATREEAIRAFEALRATRSSVDSRKSQVKASTLALEGVRQESEVGTRTVLDVLNAEQELLDARTGLVRAEHDATVAQLRLYAATGRLNVATLSLPTAAYDPDPHYQNVRNRWIGWSISE